VLNAIDAYTRESLAMEVNTSLAGLRLTRMPESADWLALAYCRNESPAADLVRQ
jgi:hypothetical protein